MATETELRDRAALERTRLANERTLLAYVRTGLAVVVAGLGMHLIEVPFTDLGGTIVILLGILIIPFGFWRYLRMRRQIEASARTAA